MNVASTISGLGTPSNNGQLGIIRIGSWPDVDDVLLRWNSSQQKWVSSEFTVIKSLDTIWLKDQSPFSNWMYLNQVAPGGGGGGCTSFNVSRVGELFAAGLHLQDRSQVRAFAGASGGRVAPWFYEQNDEDWVEFANDIGLVVWPSGSGVSINDPPSGTIRPTFTSPDTATTFRPAGTGLNIPYSPNIGKGNDLVIDSSGTAKEYAVGWKDVNFFVSNADGTLSSTAYVPQKRFIYPALYGYGSISLASYAYEMRWVG